MKIIKVAIILSSVLMLCSCSVLRGTYDTSKDTEEVKEEVNKEMTKEQEEILRTYGLEEEKIAKLKEEGMDYGTQSFVDTAMIMLDYLEKKYNEKFIVVGGYIPGLFVDEYSIVAQVTEGEFEGTKFDVYYLGEKGCKDGYVSYKVKDKACNAIKKLLQSEFPEMQVFADIHGEYGDEVTLDMTGEELVSILEYDLDLVIAGSTMTEEDLIEAVNQVEDFLDKYDVGSSGLLYCVDNLIDETMTQDEAVLFLNPKNTEEKVFRIREPIATFN